MGATLSTLRKYIRAEVNDPAPTRKLTSSTIVHDGGSQTTFAQDATHNFVSLGVLVGDVIYNVTDGGSLAVVRGFANSGTSTSNDKLMVDSIDGGTGNTYEDDDVLYIYDRHAQRGLDGTRWTDSEVEDALAQAQKLVALRFGGVEKFDVNQEIKVVSKVDLVGQSGTFTVDEQVTDGTHSHDATVRYVGDDFILITDFITRIPIDGVSGTFKVGETVTSGTNSYTGVIQEVNAAYLDVYRATGTCDDDETLTGGTTGATASVNSSGGYSAGVFPEDATLTGSSSSATGIVRDDYTANNFYMGQALPTDLRSLLNARWWNGSTWESLKRDHIIEYERLNKSSGDPKRYAIFDDKIWLWPNNALREYNELHLTYLAWDNALSADTTTTLFDVKLERLLVLEAACILAGQAHEEDLYTRLRQEIQRINQTIEEADDDQQVGHVLQEIDWNGWGYDGGFM